MKLDFCLQIFQNTQTSKFMKILPIWLELFLAHGRTDMMKLKVAFRKFVKAPNKLLILESNIKQKDEWHESGWFRMCNLNKKRKLFIYLVDNGFCKDFANVNIWRKCEDYSRVSRL